MQQLERIVLFGATGMVGSAFYRILRREGYRYLFAPPREEIDLLNGLLVEEYFKVSRPDHVIMAAGLVGGIKANSEFPADFLYQNLAMNTHVIEAAHRHGVKSLLYLGSSCMYPKDAAQPCPESALLTGPIEVTNEPYAIAKIAGMKLVEAYNKQHGTNFIGVVPSNLFGPFENFEPENSHVIAGLMRRFHEAKVSDLENVVLWGSGQPRRDFLYVDDLVEACLLLLNKSSAQDLGGFVNIGSGQETSILDLATAIANVVNYDGKVGVDTSKPDGALRRLLDSSRMTDLGWSPRFGLERGLLRTYEWFCDHCVEE
ncbi:MAG: GDP-L-fucose synthase [Myxococcota bacterium]|nr:GDP-L-fucose synthase [Myxococcota bacterium]